jgi:hypothetical protein
MGAPAAGDANPGRLAVRSMTLAKESLLASMVAVKIPRIVGSVEGPRGAVSARARA